MVAYQSVFIVLFFVSPGPPYDHYNARRAFYYILSFSAPSLICFFLVLVSTTLLVIRLKQNLEWRKEATKQSNNRPGSSMKERKAARSVVAICTIFIICFAPNVALFVTSLFYPNVTHHDPYLGSLMRILYSLSNILQVLSSAVNIVIYYRMGTKYQEIIAGLFCRQRVKKG